MQKAEDLVVSFAELAKDTVNMSSIKEIYPNCNLLLPYITVGELTIYECKKNKDDTYTVNGENSYYDDNGKFVQNKVSFLVGKNGKSMSIRQSTGLLQLPKEMECFGKLTGAIREGDSDLSISKKYDKLSTLFFITYVTYQTRLNNGIKINYWEWDADYGTPNGKATVTNTLPFDVYNVKYRIVYSRSKGGVKIGEDEGIAFSNLKSGQKQSFAFYSSGVSCYGGNAHMSFELPQKLALEWMLNDEYTGNEFEAYK